MKGKRISIFGLARSGLAVVRAAKAVGAIPIVVDQKPREQFADSDQFAEAEQAGAEVRLGWTGEFDPSWTDLVVTSPGVPRNHPKLLAAVASGLEVVSEIEFAFRITKAPIVAITGTNGKSTTTVMTWLCLRAAGEDAILCGNISGSGYAEMPLSEAAAQATKGQVLVAEVSSFQLEWVDQFKPVVAGITNISADHLDRYEGIAEYAATKHRIFARQGPEDFAVVPSNDPLVGVSDGPQVFTFGAEGDHGRIEASSLVVLGKAIRLESLPFAGEHNYNNAAMALLLSASYLEWRAAAEPESRPSRMLDEAKGGVPDKLIEGLRQFRGLSHRMERLGARNGIQIINNSMCTNPAAVVASAQSIREPKHLLLGGTNKKLDFKPLQNYLDKSHNRAYLFGKDAAALNSQLGGPYPVFATMKEAFDEAVARAKPGEVVMLSPGCASMDQFEDFRHRGDVFKAMAKEWLEYED